MEIPAPPIKCEGFSPEQSFVESIQLFIADAARQFDLNLQDLEAVTIAEDYKTALGAFDTGFGPQEKIPVSRGSGVCIGMTPEVFRAGRLRSHVILPHQIAKGLLQADGQSKNEARYAVTHELAHVDEHHKSATCFSADIIKLHHSPDRRTVGKRTIWSEYYVCRKVAAVHPGMSTSLEELFVRAHEELEYRVEVAKAHIAGGTGAEIERDNVIDPILNCLIAAARLLGHLERFIALTPKHIPNGSGLCWQIRVSGLS